MFTPNIDLEVLTKATILRFSDITGEDTVFAPAGTGWDGGAGVDSTDVTAATLTITDPNDDTYTINCLADILAADPITGDNAITFDDQTGEWVDGYYDVDYKVWMQPTNITKFEDYSGTVTGTTKVTSATHLLETGMYVTIASTTNYNGFYAVTKLGADTYYIYKTFVANDATGTSTPCYFNSFTPFVYTNIEMALERMYAVYAAMDEGIEADEYLRQCEEVMGLYNALKSALASASQTVVENIYGRITRILDFNSIELTYS